MKNLTYDKKPIITLVVFILILVAGEVLLEHNVQLGFILYAVLIFFSLIVLAYNPDFNGLGNLAIFLLIIPILRIVEIFLNFSFLWRSLVFYLSLLALVLFYVHKLDIRIDYKKGIKFVPIAVVIGLLLGIMGNYVFHFAKLQTMIIVVIIAGFSEEIFFRGMIQSELKKDLAPFYAILIPSILLFVFSFNYGLLYGLFSFIVSLITGFVYDYSDSITACIVINIIITALLFAL